MDSHLQWDSFENFELYTSDGRQLIEKLKLNNINTTSADFQRPHRASPFTIGQEVLLKCQSKMTNTELHLQIKITKLSETKLSLIFLKCVYQQDIVARVPNEQVFYPFAEAATKPTIWALHPWFISQKIIGTVIGAHGTGIKARLNLDQRIALLPGIELDFVINYPSLTSRKFKFKLLRIYFENDAVIGELEVLTNKKSLAPLLGKCVTLSDPEMTLSLMKQSGLILPELRWSAHIDLVSTPAEMSECLKLRKVAYSSKQTSTFDGSESEEHFRDPYDNNSAIMLVKLGQRSIGTGRIVFNNFEKNKSEIAQLTELPEKYWREGFIETSRFATSPEYRGRDVFLMMLYLNFKLCFLSGFRYLLIDCEDHLLPVYKKMGGKDLQVRFKHPLEGVELSLVEFDLHGLMRGKGMGFKGWLFGMTPLLHHLDQLNLIRLNPFRKVLVQVGNIIVCWMRMQKEKNG